MYRAGKFAATYHREGGESLWHFLNEDTNIIRMETACYLSRPAVEPLSPFLLNRFGAEINRDRIKQMIGHMVRQILEKRGYQLQQGNVKISRVGNIFSRASRYTKPDRG